ncbi:MAG TPA: CehA/McbA family metallohydrolase [Bacillota bacterium]
MNGKTKWRLPLLVLLMVTVLTAGTWSVQAAEPNWFIVKGDLNCHSNFTIGVKTPPEQVIKESAQAGYDFIALTEQNTILHLQENLSTPNMVVLAGYELVTPIGRLNLFGLRTFDKKTAIYSKEELAEYVAYLKKQGGLLQLNHPNDKKLAPAFGYDMDVDFIEIVNGAWSEDDQKTLQDYQTLLTQGRKLVATGGTDAKSNYTTRNVYNNVLVSEKTEKGILEGLAAGRNFVTLQADGPVISMKCGDTLMGGTVAYKEGQTVNITINNLASGALIKVYTAAGLAFTDTYTATDKSPYVKEVATKDIKFCRVEVWSDEKTLCAYSNPIYIQ